jgi:hypothetical protein
MNNLFLYCDMVVRSMSGQNTAPVRGYIYIYIDK